MGEGKFVPYSNNEILVERSENHLDESMARSIATDHLQTQVNLGRAEKWRTGVINTGIPMLNLTGYVYAYYYPIKSDEESSGYIVVTQGKNNLPEVIEFSSAGKNPLELTYERALESLSKSNLEPLTMELVYTGPLAYYLEIQPDASSNRRFYSIGMDTVVTLPKEVEKQMSNKISKQDPDDEETLEESLGYYRIPDVPEWTQFNEGLDCYSGCVPTSVATIMGYWDRIYTNLIGTDWRQAALEIRNTMGTYCVGTTGITTMDVTKAIMYPRSKGYNFNGTMGPDPNLTITYQEINANRPLALGFQSNDRWSEDHTVVGIGYNDQYLIVRDNWPGLSVEAQILSKPFWTMRFCPPDSICEEISEPLACPQTGGVILYQNSSYDCGNQPDGLGFILIDQAGKLDWVGNFNDRASSIRVPNGWSVALYEHTYQGGGAFCVDAPGLSSFASQYFSNGVNLDNNVTSVQVFTQPGCAPSTPNDISDNSPPYGTIISPINYSNVGRSVTIEASASDTGVGVKRVEFIASWSDGWAYLGEDQEAPYQTIWDTCSQNPPNGEVHLWIIVADKVGNYYVTPGSLDTIIYKNYTCNYDYSWWLWGAKYWNNIEMSGEWITSAIIGSWVPYLYRHLGFDSPSALVNSDYWSAEYKVERDFPGGTYLFHCQYDDGCRVLIDGSLYINNWYSGFGHSQAWAYLPAGMHTIQAQFRDLVGEAFQEIWWQGPGFLPLDLLPEAVPEYGYTWLAEYWSDYFGESIDRTLTPHFSRLEGTVLNHPWGMTGPDPMMVNDYFRSKFTRQADFDCGTYRFSIEADDGVRLTIDGQVLVDRWYEGVHVISFDRAMSKGVHQLRVDHYEAAGDSQIHLDWEKISDCNVTLTPKYVSKMYVKPDEDFAPSVRIEVTDGYLDPLRNDTINRIGGSYLGDDIVYLRDTVEKYQQYSFDANSPDEFWLNSYGLTDGIYTSDYQVMLNGSIGTGPINRVEVIVDSHKPSMAILSPSMSDDLSEDWVLINVSAIDYLSEVEQVSFYVGCDTGYDGWQWHLLNTDIDPLDGWTAWWNIEQVPPQTGAAIFAYGYDRSNNIQASIIHNLSIHSESLISSVFIPLVQKSTSLETKTVTITADPFDGEVINQSCSSWNDCWSSLSGNLAWDNLEYSTIGAGLYGSEYSIKRTFLFFDSSVIPIGSTIKSVTLSLYAGAFQNGNTTFWVVPSQASIPLTTSSFSQISWIGGIQSIIPANTWGTISLLSDWITQGGMTKLALIHNNDYNNLIPTGPADLVVALSENFAYRPILTITYTTP